MDILQYCNVLTLCQEYVKKVYNNNFFYYSWLQA
jgi:hypothetical protein